jgi:hypothetical protein
MKPKSFRCTSNAGRPCAAVYDLKLEQLDSDKPDVQLVKETERVVEDSILSGLVRETWIEGMDRRDQIFSMITTAKQIMLECEDDVRQDPKDIRKRSWALRLRAVLDNMNVQMDPPRWRSCIVAVEEV